MKNNTDYPSQSVSEPPTEKRSLSFWWLLVPFVVMFLVFVIGIIIMFRIYGNAGNN